jgi:hypothetical protein
MDRNAKLLTNIHIKIDNDEGNHCHNYEYVILIMGKIFKAFSTLLTNNY